MAQKRGQNLKTVVYNISDRQLTIKDHYIFVEGDGFYGTEEFEFPPGMRRKIRSGNFIKALLSYNLDQEIHVMSGEHVLHAMSHGDFHDNKGKELLLDILGDRFRYAFVHPTQGTTCAVWNYDPVYIC